MGACYDSIQFNARTDVDAVERVNAYIDECLWEDGHSPYSGTMGTNCGVRMTDKVFEDADAAHDWLEENTEKRGNVIGVKVDNGDAINYYVFGAMCGS